MAKERVELTFFNSRPVGSAAAPAPEITKPSVTTLRLIALLEKIRGKEPVLQHILSTY
jgi:hypothetical protein